MGEQPPVARSVIYWAVAICLGIPGVSFSETLNLVCHGIATRREAATTSGFVSGSYGESANLSGATIYHRDTPDSMTLEISGDSGRIRVPIGMIPGLHSSGSGDGWWPLDHIVVGDAEITAQFSMNFLNKPRVRIDRRIGEIIIQGLSRSGFHGACVPLDPNARKF